MSQYYFDNSKQPLQTTNNFYRGKMWIESDKQNNKDRVQAVAFYFK